MGEINANLIEKIKKISNELLQKESIVTLEELNKGYEVLQKRFNPEKLKSLDGKILLEHMFHIGNKEGLLFNY